MTIEKNKFVSLTYKLKGSDGELIEETDSNQPLEFVFGTGRMIPMFEQKLCGLKQGDSFDFSLQPEEAYGERNEEAVVELPMHLFEIDGVIDDEMLTPGNVLPMQNTHGDRMDGLVLEVKDNTVMIDFNLPLAGETLFFSGSVLEVRDATNDEMNDSCNGGCDGGCSGGCGCGC
ncbi:MAG: peptidylprolyl isomerase [Cytophagaceae bacterium]|jgi:FKBP-type peptidyl-prolyl cis-trans isomerase SlyD|nr:peptidylprolyl isomerase [Cytophagaceae bacterium]